MTTIMTGGAYTSLYANNLQPNSDYDYLWLSSTALGAWDYGYIHVSHVEIVDHGQIACCQQNLAIANNSNLQSEEAISTITVSNSTVQAGNTVNVNAGHSIHFSPNTRITSGSNFRAFLQACSLVQCSSNRMAHKTRKAKEEQVVLIDPYSSSSSNEATLFPNPASDYVHFGSYLESVQLISSHGEVIISAQNVDILDVSDITAGIYTVKSEKGTSTLIVQ